MELFPSILSAVVFCAYIILFTFQGILVTTTKEVNLSNHQSYAYNIATVVMLTECLKLIICSSIYIKQFTVIDLFKEIIRNAKILLLYFVPAFLYCLYNNLTFVNLSVFDPTTYYLLLQIRVVVTGVVFQVLFKKQLSKKQWISLLLLTFGCIVKQMHSTPSNEVDNPNLSGFSTNKLFYFCLILVQVFCSCFAGVYNEYLLKEAGAEVHLMIQNVFMYIDSIICNFMLIILKGEITSAFSSSSLSYVFQPFVVALIINGSVCGIITSVFLKKLNSILKTFAGAIEIVFTATMCWLILGIAIDIYTVIAIAIVFGATYLYAQNPVVNKVRLEVISDAKSEEKEKFIAENV